MRSDLNIIKYAVLSGCLMLSGVAYGQNESPPIEIVVEAGDTLSSIVIRETGRRDPSLWQIVAAFNNRTVDQTLEIGDIVLLPPELVEPQSIFLLEERVAEPGDAVSVDRNQETTESKVTESVSSGPDSPLALVDSVEAEDECSGQQVCLEVQESVGASDPIPTPPPVVPSDSAAEAAVTTNLKTGEQTDAGRQTTPVAPAVDPVGNVPPPEDDTSKPAATTESNDGPNVAREAPVGDPAAETEVTPEIPAPAPPPAPGLFEVDEDAAVRALERSLVQLNALLLRPRRGEISITSVYSNDSFVSPPFLFTAPDGSLGGVAQSEFELTDSSLFLDLGFGLPYDSQIGLTLPFRSTRRHEVIGLFEETTSNEGMGDVVLSIDKTLATEKGRRPDIIFSVTYDSESGSTEVSSNAEELTLRFSATKRQDPLVFTGNVSRRFALSSNNGFKAGDVTRISLGTLLAASPYTSLQFLFSHDHISASETNGELNPNSDANIASFSFGVSSVVSRDVFLNAQVETGLGEEATDYRFVLSLARQFSF